MINALASARPKISRRRWRIPTSRSGSPVRGTAPLVVSCQWLKPTDRNRTLFFIAIVVGLAISTTIGPPKTHSKSVVKLGESMTAGDVGDTISGDGTHFTLASTLNLLSVHPSLMPATLLPGESASILPG
jgi:hypothetical protein